MNMAKDTRKEIMDTFMELLNKKPLSKITITEIITEANISRNTFYYYFDDIFDLIKQLFEVFTIEFKAITNISDTLADEMEILFGALKENRRAIRHLYDTSNHLLVERYIQEVLDKAFIDFFTERYQGIDPNQEDIKFISKYHRNAMRGFIMDWVNNDNEEELETLLRRIGVMSEEMLHQLITYSVDILDEDKEESAE